MRPLDFKGKVALVTGAGNGLGLAHARALAERGAQVMINDFGRDARDVPVAQTAAIDLYDQGYDVDFNTGSVGIEDEAVGMVEQTIKRYGHIDILINNAGHGISGTAQDTKTEDLMSLMNVHVLGMFWTMRTALQNMRRRNYGRIINTTSATGVFGAPGIFPYVTVKAAVQGMTRAAYLDNLDRDIRINALSPVAYTQMAKAYFDSQPQINTERLLPQRVSPAAVYLAHDTCTLNGQTLSVAAGRVAGIFAGTAPGFTSAALTAEEVADHLAQILDRTGYIVPGSSVEQYALQP